MEKLKFSRKYLIVNEVLNAVTHGIGFGLSIAGLVILIVKGGSYIGPNITNGHCLVIADVNLKMMNNSPTVVERGKENIDTL